MTFDVEQLDQTLLLGSAVVLVAIIAVRFTSILGLPSLLLYLLLGVLLGESGFGIQFEDAQLAHALGFGALTGWWSHLASAQNSELGILIYSSGFFATVISMRSLFVFTTALLPTVAATRSVLFPVAGLTRPYNQHSPTSPTASAVPINVMA